MWEIWPADAQGGGALSAYWFDEQLQYVAARLDPATGALLPAGAEEDGPLVRATLGGHHFVDFHYSLHAGTAGLWIVGIATMAMLVALISGVITHKHIFKDFFTFRPKKGQRSWLDAHNAVAVLTLPFQFMIAYTGLAFFATTYLPATVIAQYGIGDEGRQHFAAALGDGAKPQRSGRPMAVPELEPFARRGAQMMGQPVRAVVIDHPGDAAMRIGVYGWNDSTDMQRRISATTGMATFSAATGELLRLRKPGDVDGGAVVLVQQAMSSLHMATFGALALKWLYFLCGLAGTAMMGTGAILFVVKRRHKHGAEFGAATARMYRLIEAMNVAAIAGLAVACIAYLWANRLIPVAIEQRAGWELQVFFGAWLLALAHAFVRPAARAWTEQWQAFAGLCLLLPVLNWLTTGDHLLAQMARADWESAGVELTAIAFGVLGARIDVLRGRRTPKAAKPPVERLAQAPAAATTAEQP